MTVWCSETFKQQLKIPRKREVHCVTFSDTSIAYAVGRKAVIFGGYKSYGWRARPDFEVIAEMLDFPESLSILLDRFPSAGNVLSMYTGETILQRCVRMHSHETLCEER